MLRIILKILYLKACVNHKGFGLFSKSNFEKSNYGEYFVYLVADLLKNKVNIKEIGYICETRIHGESKTASNLFQLISRGIPYIKAAYNCRGAF